MYFYQKHIKLVTEKPQFSINTSECSFINVVTKYIYATTSPIYNKKKCP